MVLAFNNLAGTLDAQEKHAEAEALYRKALALARKVLGEEHPDTIAAHANLASALDQQGRFAEAQPLFLRFAQVHGR